MNYIAGRYLRLDKIDASIQLAEAKHKYVLSPEKRQAMMRYIDDNIIDAFIKQSETNRLTYLVG